MVRNDFSYWLTVNVPDSTDIQAVMTKMDELEITGQNGTLIATVNDRNITCEVNPKAGTVEEDSYMEDHINQLAKAFPNLNIELRANNELNHVDQQTIRWTNGDQYFNNYARMIPSDELYDKQTVRDIVTWLRSNNLPGCGMNSYADAANEIEKMFII